MGKSYTLAGVTYSVENNVIRIHETQQGGSNPFTQIDAKDFGNALRRAGHLDGPLEGFVVDGATDLSVRNKIQEILTAEKMMQPNS